MILYQNPKTRFWDTFRTLRGDFRELQTHAPDECSGPVCDIHARGNGPEAQWPLNWRPDRGMMEVLCIHGIGHPSRAQVAHWGRVLSLKEVLKGEFIHGCDGCCAEWSPQGV